MNHLGLLAASALLMTACTKADTEDSVDDTEDTTPDYPDTGIELWGLRGTATVGTGTYSGTVTMYDEVLVPQHDRGYEAGDTLCEVDYPVAHNGSPTLACTGCEFGFLLDYTAPAPDGIRQDDQAWCDQFYTTDGFLSGSPLWEAYGVGFHADYDGAGPALMIYYPEYGTDPATWGAPYYGSATFTTGTFTWDWPVTGYYY